MARLTTKQRKKLPAKSFAGPNRSFPVEDAAHARKAIQLAPRSLHAGNISQSQEQDIVAKARRVLKGRKGLMY